MSLAVSDSGIGSTTAVQPGARTVAGAGVRAGARPPRRRLAAAFGLAGAVLVMVLSLTAFVGGSGDVAARGSDVGDRAWEFSLRGDDGQRVRLDEFHGRPVLLLFADAPAVELPPVTLGAEVAVVVVSDADLGLAAALSQRLGRPVVALEDVGSEVARQYEALGGPTAVFVDRNGIIADRGAPAELLVRLAEPVAAAR